MKQRLFSCPHCGRESEIADHPLADAPYNGPLKPDAPMVCFGCFEPSVFDKGFLRPPRPDELMYVWASIGKSLVQILKQDLLSYDA